VVSRQFSVGLFSIGQFLFVGIAIGAGILGRATSVDATLPVIRVTGAVPQTPSCFVEMPNQTLQNLDGLCQVGKPKAKRMMDLTTDLDRDGIPDELMVEFRKLDAIMQSPPGSSPAAGVVQMRQMMQAILALNERLPYAEATKEAMREMTKMMEADFQGSPQASGDKARWQRMDTLQNQMNQDPMFKKFEEYSSRFHEKKWASRSNNR
jgi:hypothetical protein